MKIFQNMISFLIKMQLYAIVIDLKLKWNDMILHEDTMATSLFAGEI